MSSSGAEPADGSAFARGETRCVAAARLPSLDLLKADVEGAERLVVRGGARTIERFRPALILEMSEISKQFGYDSLELADELVRMGYALFRPGPSPLERYVRSPHEGSHVNVVAVHRARLDAKLARGTARPAASTG